MCTSVHSSLHMYVNLFRLYIAHMRMDAYFAGYRCIVCTATCLVKTEYVTWPEAMIAPTVCKPVSVLSFLQLSNWFAHSETCKGPLLAFFQQAFAHIIPFTHVHSLINYLTGYVMYITNHRRVQKVNCISQQLYICVYVTMHMCSWLHMYTHAYTLLECWTVTAHHSSVRMWFSELKAENWTAMQTHNDLVESPLASVLAAWHLILLISDKMGRHSNSLGLMERLASPVSQHNHLCITC